MKKYLPIIFAAFLLGCTDSGKHFPSDSLPEIYPDYIGVTIPANIAPLNFNMVDDNVDRMAVSVSNSHGNNYSVVADYADFNIDQWHELLSMSKGDSLMVQVSALKDGIWTDYKSFPVYVSADSLADRGITYRRLPPSYNIYSVFMGIYCRDLWSFHENTVIDNKLNSGMCINCHTQNQTSTKDMMVHIRGTLPGTYIRHNGKEELIDTKMDSLMSVCVYNSWHPSGKYIAFSVNGTRQSFHVGGLKRIEVYDKGSDMVIYDVENHQIIRQPVLMTEACETYPSFSPDGKWLYFCSAERPENDECEKFKYNIYRIAFDPNSGAVHGEIEPVIIASANDKNATFLRISPDGKYLMYCECDYGSFPIHHPESEIRMLNLSTMTVDSLSIANSGDADSFHNWSADSHWFVFCSRRDDGLHTRLYIGHIDNEGHCDKPFMLPQENPKKYYSDLFQSYNTPDFCDDLVDIDHQWLLANLKKGGQKVTLK